MRIDRFIADNSHYSRAEVKRLIKQKLVLINDRLALNPAEKTQGETVTVDGVNIIEVGAIYLMLNKPKAYVSSTLDNEHFTVIDLLKERSHFLGSEIEWKRIQLAELQICGRLDIDTTGLVLLTNDGQWNHQITSPNSDHKKTYHVGLLENVTADDIEAFKNGIQLKNEDKACKPAELKIVNNHAAIVTIHEGKYHQIKRMFAACGNKVSTLHRSQISNIKLDDKLPAGHFRFLTQAELGKL